MPPSNPTLGTQVHNLELRVVTLEVQGKSWHESEMEAIADLRQDFAALREDLSEAGKHPHPVPEAKKSGGFSLPMPDTLLGYAKVLAVYLPLLGTGYAILRSGAQAGAADGATTAVEAAVDHGKAAPVAVPAPTRVVPVPIPTPIPVPIPVEPPPDDLLPDLR